MSNHRILQRIADCYEEYRSGALTSQEFTRNVKDHIGGLEGLEYHAHTNRIDMILFELIYLPVIDGNITRPYTNAEMSAILQRYEAWFDDVSKWIEEHEPVDEESA